MKNVMISSVVMGVVMVLALSASGEVIWDGSGSPSTASFTAPAPSRFSDFNNPPNGWTLDSSGGPAGSDPGFAHYADVGGSSSSLTDYAGTELVHANGWFAETRALVIQESPFLGGNWGMMFAINDDSGVGAAATFNDGSIKIVNKNMAVVSSFDVEPGVFHTLRVVRAPGAADVEYIIDGISQGLFGAVSAGQPASVTQWGNAYAPGANEGVWDYVVLNGEIPEPMTLALLGMGGLVMLWKRRR